MKMEELIWKLIDISDIKKEYMMELNELIDEEVDLLKTAIEKNDETLAILTNLKFKETQESMHKIQRMLLSLDEEFLVCMNQLKEEGDVVSIAELDGHRYTRLRDLQKEVEGVVYVESLYNIKRKEVHELKIEWMKLCKDNPVAGVQGCTDAGRAASLYKKAQVRTP